MTWLASRTSVVPAGSVTCPADRLVPARLPVMSRSIRSGSSVASADTVNVIVCWSTSVSGAASPVSWTAAVCCVGLRALVAAWNKVHDYPGVFGAYSFSPTDHNGYPQEGVVMSLANSQKDGAFVLAPA